MQIETDSEWNPYAAKYAEIDDLRKQLAEHRKVIEMERSTVVDCWGHIEEQSALIEKLAEALQNVEGTLLVPHNGSAYHALSINEYGRCVEALTAYESWKGK